MIRDARSICVECTNSQLITLYFLPLTISLGNHETMNPWFLQSFTVTVREGSQNCTQNPKNLRGHSAQ